MTSQQFHSPQVSHNFQALTYDQEKNSTPVYLCSAIPQILFIFATGQMT